jgi:hypothetical protein
MGFNSGFKGLTLGYATGHRMEFRHSTMFPSSPFNFLQVIFKMWPAKCVNFFLSIYLSKRTKTHRTTEEEMEGPISFWGHKQQDIKPNPSWTWWSFFWELSGRVYYIVAELEDILQQYSLRFYIRYRSWWRLKPDVVIPRLYVTFPCMYTTLKNCLHENYKPGYHLEMFGFFFSEDESMFIRTPCSLEVPPFQFLNPSTILFKLGKPINNMPLLSQPRNFYFRHGWRSNV